MAKNYPGYRRQLLSGTKVTTPAQVDFAGAREQERAANQLSRHAERIYGFAYKRAKTDAIAAGERAAARDPRGVLESYGGEPPQNSFYDEAAFAAAVKLAGMQIENAAKREIEEAWLKGVKEKGSAFDFMATASTIKRGYVRALGLVDPLTAARVNANIDGAVSTHHKNIAGREIKRAETAAKAVAVEIYSSYRLEAGNLSGPTDNDNEIDELIERFKSALGEEHQESPTGAAWVASLRSEYHHARVRREFSAAVKQGPEAAEAYIKAFEDDIPTGEKEARGLLSAEKKNVARPMGQWLRAQATQARAEKTAEKADIRQSLAAISSATTNLELVSPEITNALLQRARATGDKTMIRKAAIQNDMAGMVPHYRVMAPAALATVLDTVRDKATADGHTDERETAHLALLEKIKTKSDSLLGKNLVAHYNFMNPENPLSPINPHSSSSVSERIAAIQKHAQNMGLNVRDPALKFLSESEADNFSQTWEGIANANDKLDYLEMFAKNIEPTVIGQFLSQISANSQLLAPVAAGLVDPAYDGAPNRAFLIEVLRGHELVKKVDGLNNIKFVKPVDVSSFEGLFRGYAGPPGEVITAARFNRALNMAKLAFVYQTSRFDQGDVLNAESQKKIIHQSLGGIYKTRPTTLGGRRVGSTEEKYGGVVKFRGAMIPLTARIAHDGPDSPEELLNKRNLEWHFSNRTAEIPHVLTRDGKMDPVTFEEIEELTLIPTNTKKQGVYFFAYENRPMAILMLKDGQTPATIDLHELLVSRNNRDRIMRVVNTE